MEIGNGPNLKRLLPNVTTFYYVGRRSDSWKARSGEKGHSLISGDTEIIGEQITFLTFIRLVRALRRGDYDLVTVTPAAKPVWRPDHVWFVNVLRAVSTFLTKFRLFGPLAIRFAPRSKFRLIVIDRQDEPTIRAHNLWLLERCDLYFKRELPQNEWKVFVDRSGENAEISQIRSRPVYQSLVRRLRPLPMPLCIDPGSFRMPRGIDKTHDVFYAGESDSSTVRAAGLRVLDRLHQKGYKIDCSTGGIAYSEYLERCHRAWLVWSPEGQGWQTWRCYEAIIMGAIPVINYPGILRYQPLIDCEHCFYYACEGDALEKTIVDALWDKSRLLEMAKAAQEHLRRFYSRDAMIDYLGNELEIATDLSLSR